MKIRLTNDCQCAEVMKHEGIYEKHDVFRKRLIDIMWAHNIYPDHASSVVRDAFKQMLQLNKRVITRDGQLKLF
jgi:hypothetical protein